MDQKQKPVAGTSTSHQRIDFRDTFERNFITHGGAVKEFLLKPSELDGLDRQFRRSPYETETSILVYNRRDVEKRAIQKWGSLSKVEREKRNREYIKKIAEQYKYELKKNLRNARRQGSSHGSVVISKRKTNEPLIIALALFVDVLNFLFKVAVWFHTFSDSVLAETIHSVADTLNQSMLVVGLCQLAQQANSRHPYGYSNMMYVVSLISGVGIFCLGAAVSVFNGVLSITSNNHLLMLRDIQWAFAVLAFSACTDSVCLCCSIIATYRDAKHSKLGFFYHAFSGIEPGLTVILLEDFAAVLGNLVAAAMLFASWRSGSNIPDAVGCIVIGFLLGIVALFLIVTNSAALVGRSIPKRRLDDINNVLESDVMIRAVYDVKGIDIGNNLVRYKAEIDFDGAELTRLYLDRLNLDDLLTEMKQISDVDQLESFMINHGEKIVDLMGGEIDRIEIKVRKLFPEVRHMDLEIL